MKCTTRWKDYKPYHSGNYPLGLLASIGPECGGEISIMARARNGRIVVEPECSKCSHATYRREYMLGITGYALGSHHELDVTPLYEQFQGVEEKPEPIIREVFTPQKRRIKIGEKPLSLWSRLMRYINA